MSWLNNLFIVDRPDENSEELPKTLRVERAIIRAGAMTLDDLAVEAGLERSDVTQICTNLQRQGRIKRQPSVYYIADSKPGRIDTKPE